MTGIKVDIFMYLMTYLVGEVCVEGSSLDMVGHCLFLMAHLHAHLSMSDRHCVIAVRDKIIASADFKTRLHYRTFLHRHIAAQVRSENDQTDQNKSSDNNKADNDKANKTDKTDKTENEKGRKMHRYLRMYLGIR